jgi:hypothetical protein
MLSLHVSYHPFRLCIIRWYPPPAIAQLQRTNSDLFYRILEREILRQNTLGRYNLRWTAMLPENALRIEDYFDGQDFEECLER